MFKIGCAPRDPLFDNIAAILSTTYLLQRRGLIDSTYIQSMHSEVAQISADDIIPHNNLVDTPRPLLNFVFAARMFKRITGATPDTFLEGLTPSQKRGNKLHTPFNSHMLEKAVEVTQGQLERRLVDTGVTWQPFKSNLELIPSSIPRGHRITHMKYMFNGLLTTPRLRFLDNVVVSDCPFCGMSNGDDRRHWAECPCLRRIFEQLYGATMTVTISHDCFHMQTPLDGRELQLVLAFLHAVWRCRCAIVRGHSFHDYHDMCAHFHSVIEDPWLHGNPACLTRAERRLTNSRVPAMPDNSLVYFWDGASWKRGADRLASYGAVLRVNGVVVGRLGVYLGDQTNNEAEYQGALAVLRHALSMRCPRIFLYGDSKLVVSQLNGVWMCKADNLAPYYEQGLALVRDLELSRDEGRFDMVHVYREFNVDADAVANAAIDRWTGRTNVVIDDNWSNTHIDPTVLRSLRLPAT